MTSMRKSAVFTGVLFIIATASILVATALEPVLFGTDYLAKLSADPNKVTFGALLELLAAFTSVGIAISLYPVIKGSGAGLALGSVIFRTLEATMYIIAVLLLLSLLTLSQQLAQAGATNQASIQAIGDSLHSLRQHATLAGVFAFSLGAFIYYFLMFKSRIIPRWLSGWGVLAVILMLVACILALFSDSPVDGYKPLVLPIALQEMVLAIWLLVKGFKPVPI